MKRWQITLLLVVAGCGLLFPAYQLGAQSSANFSLAAWSFLSGGGPTSSPSFSSQTRTGVAFQQSSSSTSFALGPALVGPASPVNRPPIALSDVVRVPQDSSANPVNVLVNDSDPGGDPIRVTSATQGTNGRVTIGPDGASILYTPNSGFTGADSFTYTISDGQLAASSTVSITVAAHPPTNRAPLASNDFVTVRQNRSDNAIDVLANDSDPDGDAVKVVSVTQPAKGMVQLGPGGANLLYSPQTGFVGVESLTYTITDGHEATSTAVVSITVASNSPPVPALDQIRVPQNSSSTPIYVLVNDGDPEANPLRVIGVGQPSKGTVSIGPGGAYVTYTPGPGFSGTDSFTYTVSDGSLTGLGSVTVIVNPVNEPPVASDDTISVARDSAENIIDVLSNDGDPDNNPLAIDLVAPAAASAQGTVGINAQRTRITYTPAPGFTGAEPFTYTATDGVLTDTATLTITVRGSKVFLPLFKHGFQLAAGP